MSQNNSVIPFFILDLFNEQLITTKTIPSGDIADVKSIVYSETPIPGLNFSPIQIGGMGNRHISFTLPLVKRNNQTGNILLVKQFENLRNQGYGYNISGFLNSNIQFNPNPKVLFMWGTSNTIPLEYFVVKCEFAHDPQLVNGLGQTQRTMVSMELVLDETSYLYKAEDAYRKIAGILYQFDNQGDGR
jgi:hypothetical protein